MQRMNNATPETDPTIRTTISLKDSELTYLKELAEKRHMSLSSLLVSGCIHNKIPEFPVVKGLRTFYCKAVCNDNKIGTTLLQTFGTLVDHVHDIQFNPGKSGELSLVGSVKDIKVLVLFAQELFEKSDVEVLYII